MKPAILQVPPARKGISDGALAFSGGIPIVRRNVHILGLIGVKPMTFPAPPKAQRMTASAPESAAGPSELLARMALRSANVEAKFLGRNEVG